MHPSAIWDMSDAAFMQLMIAMGVLLLVALCVVGIIKLYEHMKG